MQYRSVEDADVQDKKVLLRVDLNVPVDANGNVLDHQRIITVLPTINYLLYSGAKQVIMISHHGRPHGRRVEKNSLRSVAAYFRDKLAYNVTFVPDCMARIPEGKLLLLENLRFHIGEETNDEAFTRRLASHADVYVNDAFGSYQAHASIVGLPRHLPPYLGFLFQKELRALQIGEAERPLVFLLGGDKASTKLPLIKSLADKADTILIGGVLTHHFLAAMGKQIGRSKYNPASVRCARELLSQTNICLPVDIIAATSLEAEPSVRSIDDIRPDEMSLDIGPATVRLFKNHLSRARTIVWNGPVGLYEHDTYERHTNELARHIVSLDCTKIAGGGDSITVINRLGIRKGFDHVSTGGGALLKYLQDGTLPALTATYKRVLT